MKYLKHFEFKSARTNSFTDDQFHMNQIKDVFQDIFDDYGIEESKLTYPGTGFYFTIYSDTNQCVLYIRKYANPPHSQTRVNIPKIDLSGHIKTLESMGYKIGGELGDRYHTAGVGRKKKPIGHFGFIRLLIYTPESFNESNTDQSFNESNTTQRTQNMMADIKDVFQELIDEYDIYYIDEYDDVPNSDKNYYYKLYKQWSDVVFFKFITAENDGYESYHKFGEQVKVLLPRLESMGYEIDYSKWMHGFSIKVTDFDI